jgi:hypothetical protein
MQQGILFLAISSLRAPTRRERERTMVAGYDMCASSDAQFKRQASHRSRAAFLFPRR